MHRTTTARLVPTLLILLGTSAHAADVVADNLTVNTQATIAGATAPGTPTATQVLIAAGQVKTGAAVTAAGVLKTTNATASTSTATGALQVTGGAGIAGTVYAGSINTPGGLTVGGATQLNGTMNVTRPAASDAQVAATVTGAGTVGFGLNKTAAANAFGAPANTTYVGTSHGFPLVLVTGAAERMRVDSNGFVGVGATAPAAKLHVVSTSNSAIRADIATTNPATGAANIALRNTNTTAGNAAGVMFENASGAPAAFVSGTFANHNAAGSQSAGLTMSVVNAGTWVNALRLEPNGDMFAARAISAANGTANLGGDSINGNLELGPVSGTQGTPYIDFHSSTTPTDFEARIIRGAGPNASLDIVNRGTGNLNLYALDAGSIALFTSGQPRMYVWPAGGVEFTKSISAAGADEHAKMTAVNRSSTAPRWPGFSASNYSGMIDGGYPVVEMCQSRGTQVAPAAVKNNDTLGALIFYGHNGTTTPVSARISAHAIGDFSSTASNSEMRFVTSGADRMRIEADGTVVIGTQKNAGAKLSVDGPISSREMRVKAAGWSDHVFAAGYKLPTLAEVERHITEKRHLPGIPSEAEVLANGVEAGDMLNRHMAKIEELTLYAIQSNKREQESDRKLVALQAENTELRAGLAELRAAVQALQQRDAAPADR